jgi:hypothetical protein
MFDSSSAENARMHRSGELMFIQTDLSEAVSYFVGAKISQYHHFMYSVIEYLFWIINVFSLLAITISTLPHCLQVSIPMLKLAMTNTRAL